MGQNGVAQRAVPMISGLQRCMRCGAIIYDDDFDARADLPEFCDLCNDAIRDDEATP